MNNDVELYRRRYERERLARKLAEQIAEDKSRELYIKGQDLANALLAEHAAMQETEMLLRALKSLSSTLQIRDHAVILRRLLNEIAPGSRIIIHIKVGDIFEWVKDDEAAPSGEQNEGINSHGRLQILKTIAFPAIIQDARNDRVAAILGIHPATASMLLLSMTIRGRAIAYVFLESELPGAYKQANARLA
jgi:hypothetical protein